MLGADVIDLSELKGRTMINLDSEDEGIFLTSCAGGARVNCRFPMKRQELTGCAMNWRFPVSWAVTPAGRSIRREAIPTVSWEDFCGAV